MSLYYTPSTPSDYPCSYSLDVHRLHHYQNQQLNLNHNQKFIQPAHPISPPQSMQNGHSDSSQILSSPPNLNGRTKPKRAQVKNACTNCKRMCKKCDDSRPCNRCIKHGVADSCVSSERKPRARGILRGPYKKRPKNPCPSCSSSQTPQSLPPFSTILATLPTPQNSNSGSSNSDNIGSPCNCSSHVDTSSSNSNSNGSHSGSNSSSGYYSQDHPGLNNIHKLEAPNPTELDPNSCQAITTQGQGNGYTLPWILDPDQSSADLNFKISPNGGISDPVKIMNNKHDHHPLKLSMRLPNGNRYSIKKDRFNDNNSENLSSPSPTSTSPEDTRLTHTKKDNFTYA